MRVACVAWSHMAMSNDPVLDVIHLRKMYRRIPAVDDVSFSVSRGEIFGIVGPNGAGKTTLLECIEGLRKRDEGRIRILGEEIVRDHLGPIRHRIGIQSQRSGLQAHLKVREILELFASFYVKAFD